MRFLFEAGFARLGFVQFSCSLARVACSFEQQVKYGRHLWPETTGETDPPGTGAPLAALREGRRAADFRPYKTAPPPTLGSIRRVEK